MSIDRASIIRGPAIVTFGGETFYSKGDITYGPTVGTFDVETDRFGVVDTRHSDRRFEISFEPIGEWEALSVLFPYATTAYGASVYGASDSALVIHTLAGTKYTFHNAAVTSMPGIRAGVSQTLLGEVTFTALLKNSTDPTNAAAYYTVASEAYPGDTGFDACAIKTLAYASAWGITSPWDDFATEGGWEIGFDLSLRDEQVDGLGTVDMTFQNLKVNASCIPIGPTPEQVLTAMDLQGSGNALGSCRVTTGDDLNISATGVYVRLYNANLDDADLGQGTERKAVGQCSWLARRTVTAGSADPLFYVGTAAPA